ncbi:hypothetical protein CQW23_26198 [Capsicum baccatum]|uniref:Uncharacterized protein n=1 Tax=Capsicum baccatum TaxID=33114 RepID=A0A2G2VN49_CAPBA|nr:hypothetical protein CQW23_26198 [Capsicum baccatum]
MCAQKQQEEAGNVVNLNANEVEHNKLDLRSSSIDVVSASTDHISRKDRVKHHVPDDMVTSCEKDVQHILYGTDQDAIRQSSLMDLEESISCADSPSMSYPQLTVDIGSMFSGIDINSEPNKTATPDVTPPKNREDTASNVPTGVNDVF